MTASLDAALSGLKVAQRALDLTSTNIANAGTEGYTRKILPQESLLIAGKAVGARSGAAFRNVDAGLILAEQQQQSLSGFYGVRGKFLERIMDFHGPSENGFALSALIGKLQDSFTDLSSAPSNQDFLSRVLADAQQLSLKFNDFSNLINEMRQQAETEIGAAVSEINQAAINIANLNAQITKLDSAGQSTADLKDHRDQAVRTIAQYIDVNTYQEDNNLVVITKRGDPIVDTEAHTLYFGSGSVDSSKYYPGGGLNGITVDSPTGTDIALNDLGGEIGALLEMRDDLLPTYEAQLDELAQKLAYRFQQAGLTLFGNASGAVPANVVPPGAVGYVGFARQITVNQAVLNNPDLLRHGTTGNTELDGSNEVVRRVVEFAFGTFEYQQAVGTVDISAGAIVGGVGMVTNNRITGTTNIAAYPDFSTLPNVASLPGDFDITLSGVGTQTITVTAADTSATLVNKINVAFGSTVATINTDGAIGLNHNGDITLANQAAGPSLNGIGAAAFGDLGLTFGATPQPDPSFTVQVGTRNAVTIDILAADTSVELLAKLNAVQGLSATLGVGGVLQITPIDGGDITLLESVGTPLADMGVVVTNVAHTAMRSDNLGPNADISTGLITNASLGDYASIMLSSQGEETRITEARFKQEESFLQTLQKRNANISGVNVDEEMASLIRLQTAYSAAARMLSATTELFDRLLEST